MASTDFDQLKSLIQSTIQEEFVKINESVKETLNRNSDEVASLKLTVKQLENNNRKRNLIVYGIAEKQNETWTDLDSSIKEISTKLGFPIDYDHAFRLGKRGQPNRPILLKFLRMKDKLQVLGEKKKLRDNNIFLNEDLSQEERKVNSILLGKRKELKTSYPHAKTTIRAGKLLFDDSVRKITYGVDEQGRIIESLSSGSGTFPIAHST